MDILGGSGIKKCGAWSSTRCWGVPDVVRDQESSPTAAAPQGDEAQGSLPAPAEIWGVLHPQGLSEATPAWLPSIPLLPAVRPSARFKQLFLSWLFFPLLFSQGTVGLPLLN